MPPYPLANTRAGPIAGDNKAVIAMTTETDEDKIAWWDRRHELDARLEHSVGMVEDTWFAHWKCLLLGEHDSEEFARHLESHALEAQVSGLGRRFARATRRGRT